MKYWHVGGPLHGLVEEYDIHRGYTRLAQEIHPPVFGGDPLDRRYTEVVYHLQKFAAPETDAEILAKENKRHHLNYYIDVFVDSRLDHAVAKQMLMELIMLKYMRENGERI